MKRVLTILGITIALATSAQQLVQPGVQTFHRFKPNVPSLVVKSNPLTVPLGGYFDGGVEYRTKNSGWFAMTHLLFRTPNSVQGSRMNNLYREDHFFARFEFGHRWYFSNLNILNEEIERYWSLSVNTGRTDYKETNNFTENADGTITVAPGSFMDYSRIDMMLLAERGRTRNLVGPTADFYAETAWKFGWNFGSNLPVILYAIRFNYQVN